MADHHDAPSSLFTLRRATGHAIDWHRLYQLALADGHGCGASPLEQRIAGTDELLARTLRELVTLAELGCFAGFAPLAEDCRRPIAHTTATLLRLLDSALAAHGRDVGYVIEVWHADITLGGAVACGMLTAFEPEERPLPQAIERAAGQIAEAWLAITRDRLGVPAAIAQAAGELLVIYAAAIDDPPPR